MTERFRPQDIFSPAWMAALQESLELMRDLGVENLDLDSRLTEGDLYRHLGQVLRDRSHEVTRGESPTVPMPDAARPTPPVSGEKELSIPPVPAPPASRPSPTPPPMVASRVVAEPAPRMATPVCSSPNREERLRMLAALREDIGECTRCKLCQQRTQVVFGEGDPCSPLMFVGEGPGEQEDRTGRPFVGKAGQLLDRMIGAMTYSRERVYIANVVKCRPPGNRVPEPDEVSVCSPFLIRQVEIIQPKVIVCLGATAAQFLFSSRTAIGRLRGTLGRFHEAVLVPTYHPAYLERNPSAKKDAWKDLQIAMGILGVPVPRRSGAQAE